MGLREKLLSGGCGVEPGPSSQRFSTELFSETASASWEPRWASWSLICTTVEVINLPLRNMGFQTCQTFLLPAR